MADGLAASTRRERLILFGLIGGAFAMRASALWLLRPEFVGWFNHSYYYWVQAEGILETGSMPYADMPLIFHLYAVAARMLQFLGIEPQAAIVASSRCVMSLAPALIPLPVYAIVRRIAGGKPLSKGQWTLVALSAFLPLTFVHMPELLQKNMLGMLLLATGMAALYAFLPERSVRLLIACFFCFAAIVLTHLGTLAACLLFALAIGAAVVLVGSGPRRVPAVIVTVAGLSLGGMAAVSLLDPDAFARVLRYGRSSLSHSLAAGVFSGGDLVHRVGCGLAILAPAALLWLSLRSYAKHRTTLHHADRTFWLANLLFAYGLVFPLFDLDLLPRLLLFAPLPVLIALSYQLRYGERKSVSRVLLGLASAGFVFMLVGEAVNTILRDPDKEQIHQELLDLRERFDLSKEDLVLAPYAVPPICNWFLGTKASVITAFNEYDLRAYRRIFVLNPLQSPSSEMSDGCTIICTRPMDQYRAMRGAVPLPGDVEPLIATDHLLFYRLHTLPDSWLFSPNGDWIGYRESSD